MSNELPDDGVTAAQPASPAAPVGERDGDQPRLVLIGGDPDLVCIDDTCLPADVRAGHESGAAR